VAKPRVVTDLQVWMIETGRTDGDLARELTVKVPMVGTKKKNITERQIGKWRKGLSMPRYPEHIAALTDISNGRVTAQSFVEARIKEPPDVESGP
jgi:hypothetical protein